jgi:hypothetical protein
MQQLLRLRLQYLLRLQWLLPRETAPPVLLLPEVAPLLLLVRFVPAEV